MLGHFERVSVMNKPVTAFWGVCVAAALMVHSAMAADQATVSDAADGKTVSQLFIIHAPSATLERTADGQLQLTLDQVDQTVMSFADRPVRRASHLKIKTFLSVWDKGNNSFFRDPPNADFVAGTDQDDDIVFTLSDPRWIGSDQFLFTVALIRGDAAIATGGYENVSLFVDSDVLSNATHCDYLTCGDG